MAATRESDDRSFASIIGDHDEQGARRTLLEIKKKVTLASAPTEPKSKSKPKPKPKPKPTPKPKKKMPPRLLAEASRYTQLCGLSTGQLARPRAIIEADGDTALAAQRLGVTRQCLTDTLYTLRRRKSK